jgi:hypothetical protein
MIQLELGVPAVIVPEHMVFGLGYGSGICLGSVLEMVAVCASCASPEEAARDARQFAKAAGNISFTTTALAAVRCAACHGTG